jgi:hypothetical protein
MMSKDVPWQGTGIDESTGKRVVAAIEHLIAANPNVAIDIQKVSEAVGLPGNIVKSVFYILLSQRELKATFIPRHRFCGRVIGEQENSVEMIHDKAENGDFGYWCTLCGEPIEGPQDIETQIIFWRPGTDVS